MKSILFNTEEVKAILDNRKTVTRRPIKPKFAYYHFDVKGSKPQEVVKFAPHQVDDILWVRETWCHLYDLDNNDQIIEDTGKYHYRADGANPTPYSRFPDADGFNGYRDRPRWRPSIHMPKEVARIFLKVTGVRVERLQDITADDVANEGFELWTDFAFAWSAMQKKQVKQYGWDANPWVWVIEFERVGSND